MPGVIFGDMNPGPPTHWLYLREAARKIEIWPTTHKDNPALYNDDGTPTAQGVLTLERLSRLTGIRKSRLFEGKRVMAEGLIYGDVWSDGDPSGNVTEAAEYQPGAGEVVWFVDDGYSAGSAPDTRGIDPVTGHYVGDAHPRVILFVQLLDDGRVNIFDESYACLKLSDAHIQECKERPYDEPSWASHGYGSAEIRGRLQAAGIQPRRFSGKVDESIKELRSALAADENGWRRARVHPRCRHLRAEMASLVYETGTEIPVKQFDHGPEAMRGGIWILRGER